MKRIFIRFALLLIVTTVPFAAVRAQQAADQSETNAVVGNVTNSGGGTITLSGANTYSGGTVVNTGTLVVNFASANASTVFSGTITNGSYTGTAGYLNLLTGGYGSLAGLITCNTGRVSVGQQPMPTWKPAVPRSCLTGKVFYIVTEAAGLGDNVRGVPCTGNETVSDAVNMIHGLSMLSSTKLWIARPSPKDRDKSTILAVNWEDISQRGINTTNYVLLPGDRLVIQEDPDYLRSNSISKRTSPVERAMGIASLAAYSVGGAQNTPAAREAINSLVEKGQLGDDEELKQIMSDVMLRREQQSKKTGQ